VIFVFQPARLNPEQRAPSSGIVCYVVILAEGKRDFPNYGTSHHAKPAEKANQAIWGLTVILSPLAHGATIVHLNRRG